MDTQTPFATAVESFLRDTKRNEDNKSVFFKELLAQVGDGKHVAPNSSPTQSSAECADRLRVFIEDLARTRKSDSKALRLADRLRPLVDGLSQFTTACDVMVQAAPAAAIVLYGGARLVLQLAQKSYDCHDTIVDMLSEIGHLLNCYQLFSTAHAEVAEMHSVLVSSYKTIITFWQKASDLLSRKTYKLVLLSAIKPLDKEWQKCHESLEKDRRRVEFYAVAVNAKLNKQRELQTQSARKDDMRRQIVAWIKASDDEKDLDYRHVARAHLDKRHEGTGDWLYANAKYCEWLNKNESASLLLTAAPGTGKTVIAASILQRLQTDGLKTAAFFYSFNDPVRRKPIAALRTLALQLLTLHDTIPDSVEQLFQAEARCHCSKLEDITTAVALIAGLIKQIPRLHIIIDGLDECHKQGPMLVVLRSLLQVKPYGIVKWLFTSRPERTIRTQLLASGVTEMTAPMQDLTNDIRKFMQDRLQNDKCLGSIDDWINQSEGNFLWAALMLQIMDGEGLTCEDEVEEELAKFPQGLTGCYLRTLSHLTTRSERQQELACRIFAFLAAAVQPLRLSELSHALATRTPSSDYAPKRVPSATLIEELSSNLVTFDRDVKGTEDNPVLRFAHKSMQDFFLLDADTIQASENVKRFFTTKESADLHLGQACLQYLAYERYGVQSDIPTMIPDKGHAFLAYAATFWFSHLGNVTPTRELRQEVQTFLDSSAFWSCVSVQCIIAPHLYARFHEVEPEVHLMDAGAFFDLGAETDTKYGSPVPSWMDSASVGDLLTFVRQWHRVLISHSHQLKHCVMDDQWSARWPKKHNFQTPTVRCWAIQSHSKAVDELLLRLAGYDVDLECRCQAIQEVPSDIGCGSESIVEPEAESHSMILSAPRSLRYFMEKLDLVTRALDSDFDGAVLGSVDSTPSGSRILGYSQPAGQQASDRAAVAIEWIHDTDEAEPRSIALIPEAYRTRRPPRSASPYDSGFESGSTSDDSDDDDDIDVNAGSELAACKHHSTQHSLTIVQAHRKPIMYSWISPHISIASTTNCAFHPTKPWVLWSPSAHECCIANLESGEIDKMLLPEPADVDLASALSVHKDLHFSQDGSKLYYLVFAARATGFGFDGILSIATFRLEHVDDDGTVLQRETLPITLRYSWTGVIHCPNLVVHWQRGCVYIALPPLTCNPKVVRVTLPEQSSTSQLETLVNPVYVPASTPHRDPSLHYIQSDGSGEASLVLTLAGESSQAQRGQNRGDDAVQQGPMLIAWKLDDKKDWRGWSPGSDGRSDGYDSAKDTYEHLRGSYVDADQRFNVPIRSGLDWRKQAFVVSCG